MLQISLSLRFLFLKLIYRRIKYFYARHPIMVFIVILLPAACFYGYWPTVDDRKRLHVLPSSTIYESSPSSVLYRDITSGKSYTTDLQISYTGGPSQPVDSGALDSDNRLFSTNQAGDRSTSFLDTGSLTAVLPVNFDTLNTLDDAILPLLDDESSLRTIILTCPDEILPSLLQTINNNYDTSLQDVHVIPWMKGVNEDDAVINAASHATTDLLLILTHKGFSQMSNDLQDALLNPSSSDIPIGPCGVIMTSSTSLCLRSTSSKRATFLIPPLVVPVNFLYVLGSQYRPGLWATLGDTVAHDQSDGSGGLIVPSDNSSSDLCLERCQAIGYNLSLTYSLPLPTTDVASKSSLTNTLVTSPGSSSGGAESIVIIMRSFQNLQDFSSAICRLQSQDMQTHTLLVGDNLSNNESSNEPENNSDWEAEELVSERCRISYSVALASNDTLQIGRTVYSWLISNQIESPIVIFSDDRMSRSYVLFQFQLLRYFVMVLIKIPEMHLKHSDWIGTLSADELKNWHIPRLQISIVTDNRPASLARLFKSLKEAIFYGDVVDLKINMEQTADKETIMLTSTFKWDVGHLSVSHRVIHGGLLPAIVESWYPTSNDTYVLILEDDVEVSPLFYAWSKMNLLRYRYGSESNKSPSLFGISLYQQKNLELRPEGRRSFNAHSLFEAYGFEYTNTPYLSQVPCSWGAIYFPEHWTEFHRYLAIRFSEKYTHLKEDIVPNIRSNKWTRSWKKYFIELVYLRGYVMLYPNYENFASLSTNHLEVGSHVKDQPSDIYAQKKFLFDLPLLNLTERLINTLATNILDLPAEQMPSWTLLPVLDLFGAIVTEEEIRSRGLKRQQGLKRCKSNTEPIIPQLWSYNVTDLFVCDVSA